MEKACLVAEVSYKSNHGNGTTFVFKAEFVGQSKDKTQGVWIETVFTNSLKDQSTKAVHRFVYLSKDDKTTNKDWKIDDGLEIEQSISWAGWSLISKSGVRDEESKFLEISQMCSSASSSNTCGDLKSLSSSWQTKRLVGYWHRGPAPDKNNVSKSDYQTEYKNKYPFKLAGSWYVTDASNNGLLFWSTPINTAGTKVSRVYHNSTWSCPTNNKTLDFAWPYGNHENATPVDSALSMYGEWNSLFS